MEEFVKSLGIDVKGHYVAGDYVIDLADSQEYSKVYSKLENSYKINAVAASSVVNEENSVQVYENNQYLLSLVGDLVNDIYSLVITLR